MPPIFHGYFINATTNWFTGFPLKNKYQTLNATAYLENAIPEDAAAIRWLNKNITGQPTVLEACGDSYKDWDNFCITLGWDRIIISGVVCPENEKFLGMRVTEAAEKFGFEDAAALAAYLMHSEDGKTAIINMSMSQDDIDTVARLPWSNIISDAIYAKTDTPHPRMFGAFPKVLREYVAERGIYTMQEAIRRMTSQPAARMGLVGRGSLQKGNYADILVFDPKKFTDHATFTNPAQKATGLDWCIVNGQVAIDKSSSAV